MWTIVCNNEFINSTILFVNVSRFARLTKAIPACRC